MDDNHPRTTIFAIGYGGGVPFVERNSSSTSVEVGEDFDHHFKSFALSEASAIPTS